MSSPRRFFIAFALGLLDTPSPAQLHSRVLDWTLVAFFGALQEGFVIVWRSHTLDLDSDWMVGWALGIPETDWIGLRITLATAEGAVDG
jgi:hypothetical protein